ncbi:hypothetical protein FBEOM_12164 [Fusarium beomiforme]|uniref:Uncharacterized protein n=1 Tax=Fusarium beomiforme TaxID=44412 RepID=A0A9P5A862_9HYPO|nr:hypothetical protein FBEOM_12164 [Fusarium beomiforme]
MDPDKVTTEFIFFQIYEDVEPEDSKNPSGKELLKLFEEAKHQDGYSWSAWGRDDEDRNAVVWAIANIECIVPTAEWSNEKASISTSNLKRFACPSPGIVKLRTRLTPSLSSVGGILSAPIVDVTTMPFVGGTTEEEDASVREVLSTMREAVLNKLPEHLAPSYWLMSTWETRPVVPHPDSPTGQSLLSILVVGWQSTQQHYDVWKWSDFRPRIITGAGNGIGLAIVQKLLASPRVSHVVGVDVKAKKLELLQSEYPKKLHIIVGDVSHPSTNLKAVETAIQYGGRLTTLILNAATFRPLGSFPTLNLESWKRTFDINFFSIINMLQVAWSHLQESSGTVMVTSSRLSQKPCESWSCYACTKAVLNYLCGCIPLEDSRIKCIAITPGAVDTEMQTQMREEGKASQEQQRFLEALKAEGKLLKPEEPAEAYLKLVETGIPDDLNGQTVYWGIIIHDRDNA